MEFDDLYYEAGEQVIFDDLLPIEVLVQLQGTAHTVDEELPDEELPDEELPDEELPIAA